MRPNTRCAIQWPEQVDWLNRNEWIDMVDYGSESNVFCNILFFLQISCLIVKALGLYEWSRYQNKAIRTLMQIE